MFTCQKDLNEHVKAKHTKYKFKCHCCRYVFHTYNTRFKHEQGHGELPKRGCGKSYATKCELKAHMTIHGDKSFLALSVGNHLTLSQTQINTGKANTLVYRWLHVERGMSGLPPCIIMRDCAHSVEKLSKSKRTNLVALMKR